jgi:hypothetical protein
MKILFVLFTVPILISFLFALGLLCAFLRDRIKNNRTREEKQQRKTAGSARLPTEFIAQIPADQSER